MALGFVHGDGVCTGVRWSFTLPVISPAAKSNIAEVLASWPSMAQDHVWSKLTSVLD